MTQWVKNLPTMQEAQKMNPEQAFNPWFKKKPWRKKWQPIPIFLPKKFHGQRSLGGYSSWGHKSQAQLSNKVHMAHTVVSLFLLKY